MIRLTGKFEIFKSKKNGQWYWRLRSINGQTVCQSEGYTRKINCRKAVGRLHHISKACTVVEL